MLLRRNWFSTSFSLPLIVTVPGLEGCLNCLWSPLVLAKYPTIFLQHLQNIFDFVLFHIIECFDYADKGTNNNTFKQIFCVKSIKTRWHILSFCKQKSIKSYRLRLWEHSLSFITKKMTTKWLEKQIIFSESLIWPIILAIRLDNASLPHRKHISDQKLHMS